MPVFCLTGAEVTAPRIEQRVRPPLADLLPELRLQAQQSFLRECFTGLCCDVCATQHTTQTDVRLLPPDVTLAEREGRSRLRFGDVEDASPLLARSGRARRQAKRLSL